jgi:putative transposase
VRYRFLEEHKGEYRPIRKACEILGVSKSGYYEFRNRRKSNQQIEREALEGFVVEVFNEHKARYGYSRINRELRKIGITVSEKRVLGIMRAKGLQAKGTTRRYRIQKRIEPGDPRANLVEQVFTVPEPNRLWVGDITYIPTKRGFLFLATVIDTFSRKVVGWSMATTARENLVIDALEQAVGREDPGEGLVFHDDQGTQYTSRAFQKALARHGITQSVSRPGNPYDNAVAESFFKTLKRELVKGRNYENQEEARQEIFKYIELYYNTKRMHSSLGYRSPVEYERMNAHRILNNCPI